MQGQGQTISDYCGHDKKSVDAFRKKWTRKGLGAFDRSHVLTADELQVVGASGVKDKSKDKPKYPKAYPIGGDVAISTNPAASKESTVPPVKLSDEVQASLDRFNDYIMGRDLEWLEMKERIEAMKPKSLFESIELPSIDSVRRWGFYLGCMAIVFGHAALIWYDCADRWKVPGMIGGGVVLLIVLVSVIISTDPTKNRTSSYAVTFVFFVDFAAYFVHYPVFSDSANIGSIETGIFCAFICACSWVALFLFRDSKLS